MLDSFESGKQVPPPALSDVSTLVFLPFSLFLSNNASVFFNYGIVTYLQVVAGMTGKK